MNFTLFLTNSYRLLINHGSHKQNSPKYFSFEELQPTGMFSSDANCSQYLLDVKILPTKRCCSLCTNHDRMVINECTTSSYKDGCCWQCPKGHKTSLKAGSILENSNITYREFILILASFADSLTVTRTAERVNVAETTVRRTFHSIREQMAEDIKTNPKIGGPSTIVEAGRSQIWQAEVQQKFNGNRSSTALRPLLPRDLS